MKIKKTLSIILSLLLVFSISENIVNAKDLKDLRNELNESRSNRKKLESENERLRDTIDSNSDKIDDYDSEIDSTKKKINANKSELNYLNKELDGILSEKDGVLEKIHTINSSIEETVNKIYQLKEQIVEIEKNIDESNRKIEEIKKTIVVNTKVLEQRLVVMYKLGDVAKIEILLQSSGINDFLSRNLMMAKITKHDKDILQQLRDSRMQLDKLVIELTGQKASLDIAKQNSEKEAEKLKAQKAEQTKLLNSLEIKEEQKNSIIKKVSNANQEYENYLATNLENKKKLANRKAELEALIAANKEKINQELKNESSLKSDIEAKKKELGDQISDLDRLNDIQRDQYDNDYLVGKGGGELKWPANATYITSYFGYRYSPFGYGTEFHSGVDIAGPIGTDIYAAEDGVVEKADWWGGYGNIIVVNHGNGLKTRYAHLDGYYVSEGQRVKRGQVIAPMGTTGWSTGPHLHFEVRIDGDAKNPLNYIK